MVMPGICEKKSQFISKLQRRYGGARSARGHGRVRLRWLDC